MLYKRLSRILSLAFLLNAGRLEVKITHSESPSLTRLNLCWKSEDTTYKLILDPGENDREVSFWFGELGTSHNPYQTTVNFTHLVNIVVSNTDEELGKTIMQIEQNKTLMRMLGLVE